jgi:aminopeptidase N
VAPDDQATLLAVVAHYADAATFEALHTLALDARDVAEIRRYFLALAQVGDPVLAAQTAQIALSPDIPPQVDMLRLDLVSELAREHPQLSWTTFTHNAERITAAEAPFGPFTEARYFPETYWHGIPLTEMESWLHAHLLAEMGAVLERGMESARFKLAEKSTLDPQADAYVQH